MIRFVLLFVAVFLYTITLPFGILFTVIKAIQTRNIGKMRGYLSNSALSLAKAIDELGNVTCRDLASQLLIKPEGYQFGKHGENISSVLGKNERDGTLTKAGVRLANILNRIGKDHCKNSIQD